MDLIQTEFREGVLAVEATWKAVVLIPNEGGDYRGIGLVEVVWKAVALILDCRFTTSITYTTPSMGSGQVAVRGTPPLRSSCSIRLRP